MPYAGLLPAHMGWEGDTVTPGIPFGQCAFCAWARLGNVEVENQRHLLGGDR